MGNGMLVKVILIKILFIIIIFGFSGFTFCEYVIEDEHEFGPGNNDGTSIPIYPEESCIGPIINGVCKGEILHPGPPKERCYGQWLNSKCVGPQF